MGSLGAPPRAPQDVIGETPMYNRTMGELPPTPQDQVGKRGGAALNRSLNRSAVTPPRAPAVQGGAGGQGSGGRTGGFSLNRSNPVGQSALDYKKQSGIIGATVAGEANKPGGVYDRLSSKKTFTGVYKKRFEGGGGLTGILLMGGLTTGTLTGGQMRGLLILARF